LSCRFTHGSVVTAINVVEERGSANCRVAIAQTGCIRVIVQERGITNGGVAGGDNVTKECERSVGSVGTAGAVAKKRSGASSRIFIRGVAKERPRADTCAKVAVGKAQQRNIPIAVLYIPPG
jgi:hypothetical protein